MRSRVWTVIDTIAEIIGWEHTGTGVHEVKTWTDGHRHFPAHDPTVEDLLAWLRGEGFDIVDFFYGGGEYLLEFCTGHSADVGCSEGGLKVEGPTLLAALEAAVRAVAEVPA